MEKAEMDNKIYMVRVPDSLENSDWIVVAPDAEAAARLYVDGVIGETLSVDAEEMAAAGVLEVDMLNREAEGEPRVIDWGGEEVRMIHGLHPAPIETETVSLDLFQEWTSHLEDVGLEP
jgi:hypothetical protein